MEQRMAVRFHLVFPVIFRWEDQIGIGLTRDLSTAGVFVTCHTSPLVGTNVALEVQLPPLGRDTWEYRYSQATGSVVRVERLEGSSGFAVIAQFALDVERANSCTVA